MAYNRKNLLLKVKAVNEIFIKYKRLGCSSINIYNLYIKDTFLISYSTFNTYLSIPYKKQLAEIEEKERLQNNQMTINFEDS